MKAQKAALAAKQAPVGSPARPSVLAHTVWAMDGTEPVLSIFIRKETNKTYIHTYIHDNFLFWCGVPYMWAYLKEPL